MSHPDFQTWSRETATRVETALSDLLPASRIAPSRLHDAMRYSTLGGGKRVRAMLVFGAGELTGAEPERLAIAASAVEIVHAYSLIHDDLPCMDDDVLRRGKPTCHVEFDEATALLAGDALQSFAFQLLSEYTLADDAQTQLKMIQLFASAGGSRGMAGGQAIDLDAVGKSITLPELEFMHILKTGALIRASAVSGAIMAGGSVAQVAAVDRFASEVGLVFQIVDDILDVEGAADQLGKTAGKDAADDKPTYPSLVGLERSRALASEGVARAEAALAEAGLSNNRLMDIANWVIRRKN